jgi:N-acetylmuramic acid 6-phosphate (MurNAc-6-P) etherase
LALLMAKADLDADAARHHLDRHGPSLRAALAAATLDGAQGGAALSLEE